MGNSTSFSTFCLLLLTTSCTFLNSYNATNKRPELRVTGTDSIVVGLKLTEEMRGFGYNIREQSDHSIVFEKQISDPKVATRFGWRYGDVHPRSQISYKFSEQDGNVSVVADLKIITNPEHCFEHVPESAQHPDYTSIQEVFRRVAYDLEHQKKGKPSEDRR